MLFSLLKTGSHLKAQPLEHLRGQSRPRKRLQKRQPDSDKKPNIYICTYDVGRAQTCLTLLTSLSEGYVKDRLPSAHYTEEEYRFHDIYKDESNDSLRVYPDAENADKELWRNTKTPVFAIGQLEKNASQYPANQNTEDLASIYQSLLPSPPITPFPGVDRTSHKQRTLRKMRSQSSLRTEINDQPTSPVWTEDGTYLGSQTSFYSTWTQEEPTEEKYRSNSKLDDQKGSSTSTVSPATNPGFQICLDLLTGELAAAFFQQHPIEHQKRASRLQIQLLIEAYEDLLQQIQQRQSILQVLGVSKEKLKSTEKLFEHWLDVLYTLYDLTEDSGQMDMF